MKYNVFEKFVSINGEGLRTGQLSTFIRFHGCNLNCVYCDSLYASAEDKGTEMTAEEIKAYCDEMDIDNVTLTGGEPLFRKGMPELVDLLGETHSVEIETNGSIDIKPYTELKNRPVLTLDYKTGASMMEEHNLTSNYQYLNKSDCVKFAVGSISDLATMKLITTHFHLLDNTNVLISPVFGDIEPKMIIEYMQDNQLNGYRMQLQIHKFIWNPNRRGV